MWESFIEEEKSCYYFHQLSEFVEKQRQESVVYPPKNDVFKAFELTPYDAIKVVILGQDPYHQPNQAMGLCFSVHADQPLPKSLINVYKELNDDLGISNQHGDLTHWAQQGVFLLNTLLTVNQGMPLSHRNKGWEIFTDRVIIKLNERVDPLIFILWGKHAQSKKEMISSRHVCLESVHPSPLSAHRGFFGSKPFSKTNKILESWNKEPLDWSV